MHTNFKKLRNLIVTTAFAMLAVAAINEANAQERPCNNHCEVIRSCESYLTTQSSDSSGNRWAVRQTIRNCQGSIISQNTLSESLTADQLTMVIISAACN